jgi:hypothetical protein
MILGLNSQALLLFDDAIDILKEMNGDEPAGVSYGGISEEVLDAIYAPELENLIKLKIAQGKAYSTLGKDQDGAQAFQSALDVSVAILFSLFCEYLSFTSPLVRPFQSHGRSLITLHALMMRLSTEAFRFPSSAAYLLS